MDLIYDRHVAVRRVLTALFFSFAVFAGAAAALPILWQIETATALWLAAVVAAVGATTLIVERATHRLAALVVCRRPHRARTVPDGGVRTAVHPAGAPAHPERGLRHADGDARRAAHHQEGRRRRPTDPRGQVYVVTAVYAPRGLHDRVRHVWYQGAQRLTRSRLV